MNLRVFIEFDDKTNSYAAYCPELPGCASCGVTEDEALENIRQAVELYLEPNEFTLEKPSKIVEIAV